MLPEIPSIGPYLVMAEEGNIIDGCEDLQIGFVCLHFSIVYGLKYLCGHKTQKFGHLMCLNHTNLDIYVDNHTNLTFNVAKPH